MQYMLLIIGFMLLVKGADIFVSGASSVAKKFNIWQRCKLNNSVKF